ncbi:DUF481 domain-containing protein [Piscinibacter sakaiensis]|uniref:Peptide chain release factor RF-3 n=1 Tax=Piscinibacter sakaiensis TaxID=1547922 RepID=A0A0K8NXZ6_PISS1|nr:DUF481 domain-containing protein [Piscinibacter sakaiensis]GAP35149.1 peptide chain release factor RF-3 [Piscinibacter sakaiensis]
MTTPPTRRLPAVPFTTGARRAAPPGPARPGPRRATRRALAGSLLAAAAAAGSPAIAQNPPDGRWHGGIAIGGSAASGNTDARAFSLTGDATRVTDQDKINLYGLVNYADSRNAGTRTRSAELLRTGGRYDLNLSPRHFVFGGGEGETNRPGGIESRLALNVGTGWRAITGTEHQWDVFTGIGYTDAEFTDGSTRNGAELLFGQESAHKLGESSSFKQRLVFYPGSSETGNRATFDASLVTAITGGWTMNTGLAVRHASKVAAGLAKTDTLLTFGFGYKY